MSGVPRNCLDWCRGIPVDEGEFCALSHARKISRCFDGGRYTLPSPPRNVRVTPVSESAVRAEWEQPEKNAEMVELYRIMWREEGSRYNLDSRFWRLIFTSGDWGHWCYFKCLMPNFNRSLLPPQARLVF